MNTETNRQLPKLNTNLTTLEILKTVTLLVGKDWLKEYQNQTKNLILSSIAVKKYLDTLLYGHSNISTRFIKAVQSIEPNEFLQVYNVPTKCFQSKAEFIKSLESFLIKN